MYVREVMNVSGIPIDAHIATRADGERYVSHAVVPLNGHRLDPMLPSEHMALVGVGRADGSEWQVSVGGSATGIGWLPDVSYPSLQAAVEAVTCPAELRRLRARAQMHADLMALDQKRRDLLAALDENAAAAVAERAAHGVTRRTRRRAA